MRHREQGVCQIYNLLFLFAFISNGGENARKVDKKSLCIAAKIMGACICSRQPRPRRQIWSSFSSSLRIKASPAAPAGGGSAGIPFPQGRAGRAIWAALKRGIRLKGALYRGGLPFRRGASADCRNLVQISVRPRQAFNPPNSLGANGQERDQEQCLSCAGNSC